ncbi:MAG: hypothetical protein KDH98_22305 [Calditrichaeota bacterium]|nr:hypothetical protein [Calditrichota bacterium]
MNQKIQQFFTDKDKLWLAIWLCGIALLTVWNALFLNAPAFERVRTGFVNTMLIALLVIGITLVAGWLIGVAVYFLERMRNSAAYLTATFLLNIVRSVPQIVGILLGFVLITVGIQSNALGSGATIILAIAGTISLFVFLEIVDLIRERIAHFRRSDFYNAMLVCGISEWRIVNVDILWKNSRNHIFNKLIAIFGVTIFLLCSIDFIISVGLSNDVSSINLPVTLGSLLAKIDSKQDVLAIGHTLLNPGYLPNLFFKHLQGISVAFLIVFSLVCIYKIANGFARRYEL